MLLFVKVTVSDGAEIFNTKQPTASIRNRKGTEQNPNVSPGLCEARSGHLPRSGTVETLNGHATLLFKYEPERQGLPGS